MASDTDWQMKAAGELDGNDSVEVEPGVGLEVSHVEPAPESGGREMVRVELMPPGNFCVLTLPARMPVKVRA